MATLASVVWLLATPCPITEFAPNRKTLAKQLLGLPKATERSRHRSEVVETRRFVASIAKRAPQLQRALVQAPGLLDIALIPRQDAEAVEHRRLAPPIRNRRGDLESGIVRQASLYRVELAPTPDAPAAFSAVVQQGIGAYRAPPWWAGRFTEPSLAWRVVALDVGGASIAATPWRRLRWTQP